MQLALSRVESWQALTHRWQFDPCQAVELLGGVTWHIHFAPLPRQKFPQIQSSRPTRHPDGLHRSTLPVVKIPAQQLEHPLDHNGSRRCQEVGTPSKSSVDLSNPRINSKRKLGNDPNNTKWSRNTDSFGQKILRAQGWQPGDYLGAKDAPHAEWHTEANTSHIRVVLKDDTLGLGAKRNNGDECTGLDAFQHLLGRLNGKSDETLDAERKVREDLKLSLYVERKLGTIRFVKGGWLVGDQVKETPEEESPKDSADATEAEEPAAPEPKKRKASHDADQEDEKARKKEKKSKKRKTESEAEVDGQSAKDKKDSKKSKKRRAESEDMDAGTPAVSTGSESDQADSSAEAKKAKKEKKEKKKEKKEKKEKKDKKDKKEKSKKSKTRSESETEASDRIPNGAASVESSTTTPSGSGYSTPISTSTSTRYLARSRFIAQKRMALTDSAALNQVRHYTPKSSPGMCIS